MKKDQTKYHHKELPFQADANYFNRLEKEILMKVQQNTPSLPLDVSHPFVAPQGYFDTLETQVLSKIKAQQRTPFGQIWRNKKVLRWAASVILVSAFAFMLLLKNQGSQNLTLSALDSETLVAYLENENLELNEIALAYNPNELPLVSEEEGKPSGLSQFSDEELELLIDY
ncbi:hypothetical protein LAG90_01690 [Marinilongibacter aquaticus]|uniref:hypothetical protein n=1 Tax=Marinilongibacter aquaticus TaxID=2975157 RepID=UPI0021BD98F8|nr:hypothetical protein [Marinilongibacter aquaticus]UBM59369.1 hypothetical protein LAG90_01690 [Marinilongibacter aquaticus]